jgi:DNA-binding MarR family transcriptional regulator
VNQDTHRTRPLPALLGSFQELILETFRERLAEEGYPEIRPGHGCVFRFIDEEGSRLTDLAERAGLTKQAVGEVVVDLEALGHVERVQDAEDGRAKVIRLTTRGRTALDAADRIFAGIEAEWAERLGGGRIEALRETLEAIAALELEPA